MNINYPKISIITPTYNSDKTLQDTLNSVLNQSYNNIEHIIVDGCSKDNTIKILKRYDNDKSKILIEADSGLYDAINKGIKLATGDIVGVLNSDDVFNDYEVISNIAQAFKLEKNLDSIIGDIVFINRNSKIHRKYSSLNWNPKKFAWGMMPPHPSFYCKKHLFEKLGFYRNDFIIAADYELMMRFLLVNNITYKYLPMVFVKMSLGGTSTKNLSSKIIINKEVLYACKLNGINTNIFKLFIKYIFKFFELIKK